MALPFCYVDKKAVTSIRKIDILPLYSIPEPDFLETYFKAHGLFVEDIMFLVYVTPPLLISLYNISFIVPSYRTSTSVFHSQCHS